MLCRSRESPGIEWSRVGGGGIDRKGEEETIGKAKGAAGTANPRKAKSPRDRFSDGRRVRVGVGGARRVRHGVVAESDRGCGLESESDSSEEVGRESNRGRDRNGADSRSESIRLGLGSDRSRFERSDHRTRRVRSEAPRLSPRPRLPPQTDVAPPPPPPSEGRRGERPHFRGGTGARDGSRRNVRADSPLMLHACASGRAETEKGGVAHCCDPEKGKK